MSIKERPLIKAVEKLGPLPGFLFNNPYLAGFTAVCGCVLFGAVFSLFWFGLLGGDGLEIYLSARFGSLAGLAVGGFFLILTAFRAVDGPEEKFDRVKFILGGVAAIAGVLVFDALTVDFLTRYMFDVGEVICTSRSHGCR